jgi:hypothetical protein
MRAAILIACLASVSTAASAEIIDRVLATAEGHIITLSDVRIVETLGLVPSLRGDDAGRSTVDRLIDRRLVLQEVERYAPPEPDAAAIAERVASISSRFSSPAELDAVLRRVGADRTFLRQWARNELRIAQYLDQRFAGVLEPTQDEIEDYRRQHASELSTGDEVVDQAELLRRVRDRVTAERRAALIREWIDGLRARADVTKNP